MPNVVDGFQEMQLATNAGVDSLFAYNPIGAHGGTGLGEEGAGIAVPPLSNGIEAYGIIRHRSLWVAGVVNGLGPSPTDTTGRFDGNNAKDVYARFDYKIGGMGLDGDTGGQPVPDRNWHDNSLRVGAFTYRGDGSGIDLPTVTPDGVAANMQDAHFLRTGVYASLFVRDLNVFGAYVHGSDALQLFDGETAVLVASSEPSYHAWFTQADYVIYPWLHASGRYETVTPADTEVASLRTGVLSLSALVRANVKASLEYQRDLRLGDNHSLNAIVRFAF